MKTPLYKPDKDHQFPKVLPLEANTGLWYDKFCNQWCRDDSKRGREKWSLESFKKGKNETVNPKKDWIDSVVGRSCGNDRQLSQHRERLKRLLKERGGTLLPYTLESPFVTGLGRAHPVENGFAWHHTLGTPYLPGSSVKGMVRAWATQWDEADKETIKRIFGSEDDKDKKFQVGSVVFLDAIPTAPVQLKADVMTPHYGPWYRGEAPPADWHSPVPVPFLVVEQGATFLFGVLPRTQREQDRQDCETVTSWLKEALCWIGAGAKTAVGYGRFALDEKARERAEEKRRQQQAERRQAEELERQTAGKSDLYRELFQTSTEENWRENKDAFSQAGLIEGWLDRLEADPQADAIELLAELIQHHYPGLLENPDAVKGKKQKPVFKDRQRNFAKRLRSLRGGTR